MAGVDCGALWSALDAIELNVKGQTVRPEEKMMKVKVKKKEKKKKKNKKKEVR